VDFKQIEAFINVAKFRSFSKAAEAIYLSQPTISAHIASLEQELNMTLFDRHGKDVRLTKAGSLFLEYALNLINIRNTAISTLSEFDSKISGTLSIASSTTPCRFILPSIVKSFYDIYPEVHFSIKEDSTRNVIEQVILGDADIGMVGEIITDSRLSYTKIDDDRLVLISNTLDLSKNVKLKDIMKLPFISREKGSATRNVFEHALKSKGYSADKLEVFAEVSSLEAVLQFVKSGLGVSIVSELACNDYISTGLIKMHNIEDLDIIRDIYVVTHIKRTLSPTAKAFYDYITSQKESIK
jgi:DNA-binding transcriptional LysR family regulator